MAVKENPYKKYLREDRLPHIFVLAAAMVLS